MNKAEGEQLLVLACQAFETCTKLNAHVVPSSKKLLHHTAHGYYQIDGYLRIGPHGQLRTLNDKFSEPVVLVVPYISDQQGEKLRQQAIQYLDTAGNTYLHAAEKSFFILVKGQRQPLAEQPTQHRAFLPAGVQLLYHLLSEPGLLQANYRTMAEQAQFALGSVSILLKSLQQLNLLREAATEIHF
jgi:hypothetical protein